MIIAIVSADSNWAIGKGGKQLTHIPDDDKYIFATTSGQTVIMGRKTYEGILRTSMPQNRKNIVLSTNPNAKIDGAVIADSPEAALREAEKENGDVFVLGGGSAFESMLGFCDEVQVTSIDYEYDADTWFPNLDKRPEWVMVSESEEQTHFDTVYFIRRYVRRKDFRG